MPSGNASAAGHILPYIPPLVLLQIQYDFNAQQQVCDVFLCSSNTPLELGYKIRYYVTVSVGPTALPRRQISVNVRGKSARRLFQLETFKFFVNKKVLNKIERFVLDYITVLNS